MQGDAARIFQRADAIVLETFSSILEMEEAIDVSRERGPKIPITIATMPMQPAMKTNTPAEPNSRRMAAMAKALNTVDRREKE